MTVKQVKQQLADAADTTRSAINLFTELDLAQEFANRANKPQSITLVDNGYYCVTSRAIAERLINTGYQYA